MPDTLSTNDKPTALIVGVGNGLSSNLAQLLHNEGYQIVLAARNTDKLKDLQRDTDAQLHTCDATQADEVAGVFKKISSPLRVVVCNPSSSPRGSILDLDPQVVADSLAVTAYASFLVAQQAAARMVQQTPENHCKGTILLTGATAGVKGFAQSAPFAMGKFAQRGLGQSMSREFHPQGIHVCWINIDGGIRNEARGREEPADQPASRLDPDAIANTYLSLIRQHPSAWSSEMAIRPWVETF